MHFKQRKDRRTARNGKCNQDGARWYVANPQSPLAELSDVHLFAGVNEEGGPLNRAPRLSILAQTIVLQSLSVILQQRRNITPKQYIMWHPGGSLGQLRADEK
ncbi:MAG: hypothetical protein ACLVKR_00480 [Lachnospiraceae bacterium]